MKIAEPIHPQAFIHETAVIDAGTQIGENSKVWHFCHLMGGSVIGKNCSLGQNVFVGSSVVLGNGCKIQNNVSLFEGVVCEEEVFIGPSCVFTNVKNPRSSVNRRSEYLRTRVGKGGTVGANATIICGLSLGAYCFVGAGAVVTRDIPDFALVVGNPAQQIGWMSRRGEHLNFNDEGIAECPISGDRYGLSEGIVSLICERAFSSGPSGDRNY